MFGTAIILFLIAFFFAILTRVTIWLAWNLEIITSLRQKTTIKLIGLAFMLLFLCPGTVLAVLGILDMVTSFAVN